MQIQSASEPTEEGMLLLMYNGHGERVRWACCSEMQACVLKPSVITQGKQMRTLVYPDMKIYGSHWTTVTRTVHWKALFLTSIWCITAHPSKALSKNPFSQSWKEEGNVAFTVGRITPDFRNPDGSGPGQEYPFEKFIHVYNLLLPHCLWPVISCTLHHFTNIYHMNTYLLETSSSKFLGHWYSKGSPAKGTCHSHLLWDINPELFPD